MQSTSLQNCLSRNRVTLFFAFCPGTLDKEKAIREAFDGQRFAFCLDPVNSWQERLTGCATIGAPTNPTMTTVEWPFFVEIKDDGEITIWTNADVITISPENGELCSAPRYTLTPTPSATAIPRNLLPKR